jgi:hypothetical protein
LQLDRQQTFYVLHERLQRRFGCDKDIYSPRHFTGLLVKIHRRDIKLVTFDTNAVNPSPCDISRASKAPFRFRLRHPRTPCIKEHMSGLSAPSHRVVDRISHGRAGRARLQALEFLQYRRQLLQTLADVVVKYDWRCHASCLMGNHDHLLWKLRKATWHKACNNSMGCIGVAKRRVRSSKPDGPCFSSRHPTWLGSGTREPGGREIQQWGYHYSAARESGAMVWRIFSPLSYSASRSS